MLWLLLYVNYDNAQSPHQSQGLNPQEPEQQPEEHDHHWLHYMVPEVYLAEAKPPQTLVEHPKQSPHSLTVIQLGLSGGVIHMGPSGIGITGMWGSGSDAIELCKQKKS